MSTTDTNTVMSPTCKLTDTAFSSSEPIKSSTLETPPIPPIPEVTATVSPKLEDSTTDIHQNQSSSSYQTAQPAKARKAQPQSKYKPRRPHYTSDPMQHPSLSVVKQHRNGIHTMQYEKAKKKTRQTHPSTYLANFRTRYCKRMRALMGDSSSICTGHGCYGGKGDQRCWVKKRKRDLEVERQEWEDERQRQKQKWENERERKRQRVCKVVVYKEIEDALARLVRLRERIVVMPKVAMSSRKLDVVRARREIWRKGKRMEGIEEVDEEE